MLSTASLDKVLTGAARGHLLQSTPASSNTASLCANSGARPVASARPDCLSAMLQCRSPRLGTARPAARAAPAVRPHSKTRRPTATASKLRKVASVVGADITADSSAKNRRMECSACRNGEHPLHDSSGQYPCIVAGSVAAAAIAGKYRTADAALRAATAPADELSASPVSMANSVPDPANAPGNGSLERSYDSRRCSLCAFAPQHPHDMGIVFPDAASLVAHSGLERAPARCASALCILASEHPCSMAAAVAYYSRFAAACSGKYNGAAHAQKHQPSRRSEHVHSAG